MARRAAASMLAGSLAVASLALGGAAAHAASLRDRSVGAEHAVKHAAGSRSVGVFGGPVLTAADTTSSDGTLHPGVVIERQALASPGGTSSTAPYQNLATRMSGTRSFAAVDAPVGAFTMDAPSLFTSYAMGQDQNDAGTMAVTANVHRTSNGYRRRSTGPVWVQSYCPSGAGFCWKNLHGAAGSAPSVVNADGTIWVFARFGHKVKGAVRPRGSRHWSHWKSLGRGASLTAAPAASMVAPTGSLDTVEVLATGRDHRLYEQTVTGIGGKHQRGTVAGRWHRLSVPRPTVTAPAIGYDEQRGRVVVAVVDRSGSVLVSDDGASTWSRLGGLRSPRQAPALLADNITESVDLAIRGEDGRTHLATSADGGASWRHWFRVPCVAASTGNVC